MAEESQAVEEEEKSETDQATEEDSKDPLGGSLLAGKFKDVAELESGYKNLQQKLGERPEIEKDKLMETFQAELRKDVPETPSHYLFDPPEGLLPEGAELSFKEDNPTMKKWQEFAHKVGLSPAQFNEATALYVENEIAMLPDVKAEMEKLGENAQARIDRVDMWVNRHLSAPSANAIVTRSSDAEFIKAIEEVMKMTKDPSMVATDATPDGPLSLAELQELQKKARVLQIGAERDAIERQIQEGFKKLRKAS